MMAIQFMDHMDLVNQQTLLLMSPNLLVVMISKDQDQAVLILAKYLGSFVDDFEWIPSVNSGKAELDQNNGRFCVTPEYPNGICTSLL